MIEFLLDSIYGVAKLLAWNAIYFIVAISVIEMYAYKLI